MIIFSVGLFLSELLRNPVITLPQVPLTCLTATKVAETTLLSAKARGELPQTQWSAQGNQEVSGGHQFIYRLLSVCCQHSPATHTAGAKKLVSLGVRK